MDAGGNVYLGGTFSDTIDFGAGARTGGGGFLAKLSSSGDPVWTHQLTGADVSTSYVVPSAFATAADGSVYVRGGLTGTVAFDSAGGQSFTSAGDSDLLLLKLDATGALAWSKIVGDTGYDDAADVAIDAVGDVLVGLYGRGGAVDFGGGDVQTNGADVVIAQLRPAGTHVSTRSYVAAADQLLESVSVDPSGNLVVAGGFAGTLDLGAGALTSAGGSDVFVARLCP